jgi:hypothetical protein
VATYADTARRRFAPPRERHDENASLAGMPNLDATSVNERFYVAE